MKRSEIEAFLYSFLYIIVHKNGAAELFAAVKNTVTYCVDLLDRADNAMLTVNKSVKHNLESRSVILHLHGERLNVFGFICRYLVCECAFCSDLFAVSFCKNGLILHINKLILQG